MDFSVSGASPELAGALDGICGAELDRLGVFKVTTSGTTRTLIGVERQRVLMGCESDCGSSMQDVAFDLLLNGKVSKTSAGYTLELSLIDPKAGKRVSSELVSAGTEAGLVESVKPALLKLVGKQLEGRQGGLLVVASERGAGVKVDGSLIGTTPLAGQARLAAGPHLVEVQKDGFVSNAREVHIAPDELTEDAVTLVPSPDTIAAYQSFNTKLRVGAWISTAVALVGVGLFAGEQLHAGDLYGPFQSARKSLEAGDETMRDHATSLKSQIGSAQTISFVGLSVGLVAAVTATVLWLIGEDPARYDRYQQIGTR
ncbi:MAG: PEGA domain-containing protein [Myxococcaceae bacterium]